MRFVRWICAAAALLTVTGCARILGIDEDRHLVDAGPGTCDGTLLVRTMFDLSGSTKDVSLPSSKGCVDYLRELDARGGIRGCNVQVDVGDTHYDPQQAQGLYDGWKAAPDWDRVTTIMAAGTPIIERLAPSTVTDGKLLLTASYAGEFGSPAPISHDLSIPTLSDAFGRASVPVTKKSPGYPTVFFPGSDYTTIARIAMQHAWKQGAKRVGFSYCSTTSFCTDPVDGAKSFLATLGTTEIGRELVIELDESEASIHDKVLAYFQAELAQKQKDPSYAIVDWMWFGNTRTSLAAFGKALADVKSQLNLDVSVVTNTWGVDEGLYALCGDACVGFEGVQPLPVYGDSSVPGMSELVRVHDKYRGVDGEPGDAHQTLAYVAGYVVAMMWERAVTAAVDAKKPVTAAAIRDAFESFSDVDLAGFASIGFTSTDHRPQSTARIYRLAIGGSLVPVGQPISVPRTPDGLGW